MEIESVAVQQPMDTAEANDNGERDTDYEPVEDESLSEDDVSHQIDVRGRLVSQQEKTIHYELIMYIKRNKGKSYTTLDGKVIRVRVMKPLRDCGAKCEERLPEDVKKIIFKEYWSLGSRDKRVAYVANLVDTVGTQMFLTLAITNRSASISGITQQGNRGQKSTGNTISVERLVEA
ncbi:hypothetical protein PR048_000457 [Dryococelus australis]|uniref:Uncharacterized protein n=1 Tax=Dryococelus australis TaxID=614101 RepID=A0ABQ9IF75_9NEOP|nr:hypothetical protein PR048_000457 [Dryococelus australis]